MKTEGIKNIKEYEIIREMPIDELNSTGILLKHKKTGAKIALLSNDDNNKVFTIGFRTPVSDDTGVPHIIEHSVLCGSKHFPVKDPFMELAKGSLNTFLNAMTYPDKTVYPVASCNDKDFQNLMHVYMDAVFFTNIYEKEEIFKQEGWHYELNNPNDELIYNGVVYNEMKGAFSSMDSVLDRAVMHSLFPDTGYQYESGGDPNHIPELKYSQFLDFHSRYYHPSNSYIYLYGDMDMEEKLRWIDGEYLSKYDYLDIDSHIDLQKPFDKLRVDTIDYPITDSESEKDNTALAYNTVIGTCLDKELYLAFQILDYALMGMPGAPLKQAVLDTGIGKDVYSIYENGIYQPFFSIIAKYANGEQREQFMSVINSALKKIAEDGIDKKSLEAGLNNLEFKYREADFGGYPKGLMYGLQMFDSWLYDENAPFMHIMAGETYGSLREKIETDYFEELIKKYLLDNTHSSMVVLRPKKGLTAIKENKLRQKLAEYKESLTEEQIGELILKTKELEKYEEEPSSKEQLEKIPLLKISDINPKPRKIDYEIVDGAVPICHSEIFTSGVSYVTLAFEQNEIPKDYIPYLGLLKAILSYVDTEQYTYVDLSNEINIHMGSVDFSCQVYRSSCDTKKYRFMSEFNFKCLTKKLPKAFELCESILLHSKFDDYKRIREIIGELKSKLQLGLNERGDLAASLRAMSYYAEPYYIRELYSGIEFYKFVEYIDKNYESKKEEISDNLANIIKYIFRKENLIVNHTGSGESLDLVKSWINEITEKFSKAAKIKQDIGYKPAILNEGFKTSASIQYVTRSGNYTKKGYSYNGSLLVLKNIMSCEYLWNNIRVKGGAYGCGNSYTRQGDVIFTSYRDPNIAETDRVYREASDYIRKFTADEREMTKFIIGTINSIDTSLTPSEAGRRNFNIYMSDTTYEQLKEEREQILNTTESDIRECAPLVEAALDDNCICVIGNEGKIEKERILFRETKNLFE